MSKCSSKRLIKYSGTLFKFCVAPPLTPSLAPSLDLNENLDILLLFANVYIKQGWGLDLGFSVSLCYTSSRILH